MAAVECRATVERHGPNGYMNPHDPLAPIPIVLRPNESLGKYESVFHKWLRFKGLTLETLQDDPEEERRYRQCYAYTRLRRKAWEEQNKSRQRPRSWSPSLFRSRDYGQDWDRKRKLSSFMNDEYAYKKYAGDSRDKWPRPSCYRRGSDRSGGHATSNAVSARPRSEDVELPCHDHDTKSEPLETDHQDDVANCFFQDLGKEVMYLYGRPEVKASDISRTVSSSSLGSPVEDISQDEDASYSVTLSTQEVELRKQNLLSTTLGRLHTLQYLLGITSENQNCADILDTASRIACELAQLDKGPLKLRLRENYIRLTEQILVNEMAIEDLVAYVKAAETNDQEEASYHLIQIEEAVTSIREVKQHRETALAVVVAHEWTGKEAILDKVLHLSDDDSTADQEAHERLALNCGELERIDGTLLPLHVKLKILLKDLSNEPGPQAHRVEDLHQLACRASAELRARSKV
ncbi:uncharacterized protein IUM83_03186 [Phytophthora cinnamomi]|uniref:uncharacterized protein n=1 Tax=Phytophthora cinnamomi TaxID=4785 RepID=UPI0035594F8E|nr:hypothetical protein IUM83_03186 [Phytophthora cinnamomi]